MRYFTITKPTVFTFHFSLSPFTSTSNKALRYNYKHHVSPFVTASRIAPLYQSNICASNLFINNYNNYLCIILCCIMLHLVIPPYVALFHTLHFHLVWQQPLCCIFPHHTFLGHKLQHYNAPITLVLRCTPSKNNHRNLILFFKCASLRCVKNCTIDPSQEPNISFPHQ